MVKKIFVAEWCPACKDTKKKLKDLKCDYELIDVDKNEELADKHNIWSLPTLVNEDGSHGKIDTFIKQCKKKECKPTKQ